MKLTVLGCGDAFGSGGRLQSCYHVEISSGCFLIDCGATSNIGFSRFGLDPSRITTIFISHLHGDHFSGLVWWLMHAVYVSERKAPVTIVGPPGIEARLRASSEALFPGSTMIARSFKVSFVEFASEQVLQLDGVRVTPFEVRHPSGATPYALRFEADGRTLAFSGDSMWVESLLGASQSADLFIVECYHYEPGGGYHMDWKTIASQLERIGARRVMLTHMSEVMLARRGEVRDGRVFLAEDGLIVDV
jgi:ribonuclease BN (tRNA processing enzyme)